MGLKGIKIEESYDSEYDNILKEFYIPALSNSISYKRLCGEFSSSTLAIAARGIIELIKNGGSIQLICGSKFSKSDIETIQTFNNSPEEILENRFFKELDELEDEFVKDHLKAFGWMLANNLIEIKIAVPNDLSTSSLDNDYIQRFAIFHQKVGIFEDNKGDKITFSGSHNESLLGWKYNIEEFKVFRSWIIGDKKKYEADIRKFENYWTGISNRSKIISLPDAIKEKIIEIKPDSLEQLNLERWVIEELAQKRVILRSYQKDAIKAWKENDCKGIFEMATGTGKTFTALGCLEDLLQTHKKLITIITTPFNHLITQWMGEIEKFELKANIVVADSTKRNWKDKLFDEIIDINIDSDNLLIVLTTHNTFSSEDFASILHESKAPLLLIADEVHGIGAPKRRIGLIKNYRYRLGLSATPKRWFDPEGTKSIYSFFDKVVYNFPLKEAIGKFLTEYEYRPYFVSLTEEEIDTYEKITKKIAKAFFNTKNDQEREEYYSLLCINRQKIVKNAENKFKVLEEITQENPNLEYALVYCSSEQIERVQQILMEKDIIQHRFTQKEGTKPKDEYGGISERDYLIKNFEDKTIKALVAIKCLDEGIDIPQARFAIMMSNSGNPREYIQRRGRILRKHSGKSHAIIYDIIVKPIFKEIIDPNLIILEKKIFMKELIRFREFADIALNAISSRKTLDKIEEEFSLYGVEFYD